MLMYNISSKGLKECTMKSVMMKTHTCAVLLVDATNIMPLILLTTRLILNSYLLVMLNELSSTNGTIQKDPLDRYGNVCHCHYVLY